MKKTLALTLLVLVMLTASTSFAFAGGAGLAEGTQLRHTDLSAEERLAFKLDRLNELVELDRLTASQAENFETILTERMENCDQIGPDHSDHERLSIGFGRLHRQGEAGGAGYRHNR